MFLAAAAVHGLMVAPLVHSEQHAAEADDSADHPHEDDDEDHDRPEREHEHDHHHHSHGPGNGSHGAGTLSHFTVALHAAPSFAAPRPPPPEHIPPLAFEEQLHEKQRFLIPERSQAPPPR
jgi:hypothetical protein